MRRRHYTIVFFSSCAPYLEQQSDIHKTLTELVSMMAATELDAAPILVPGESVTSGPGDEF